MRIFCIASEFFHDKLTAPGSLEERAKALVSAGAAANIEGAMAILNVTIDLIVNNQCTYNKLA